jgi:hypothetical protein
MIPRLGKKYNIEIETTMVGMINLSGSLRLRVITPFKESSI